MRVQGRSPEKILYICYAKATNLKKKHLCVQLKPTWKFWQPFLKNQFTSLEMSPQCGSKVSKSEVARQTWPLKLRGCCCWLPITSPCKIISTKTHIVFLYYIPQISFFIPQNKGCSLCKEFPGVVWTGKPTCTFHKWKCERENQHTIFGNLEANLPRKQIERFLVQNIQKMNDVNGKTNTWFSNYSLQTNINFWIS